MKNYVDLIENSFEKYVFAETDEIYDAMMYSLKAGGKRIRPILLLEFAKMFGISEKYALPYAISLEMIHTYSLIHDDLPCMDNDDFRRGKPTNHKVFGQAKALLAGDGLLNLAFETMSDEKNSANFKPQSVIKVIEEVSKSIGCRGMIAGQVLDTDDKKCDIDELLKIHTLKTGMLIKSACVAGAILGEASKSEQEHAKDFAINLGIAFQIRDDYLDVYGDFKKLGKPVGSDENNEKTTYTSLYNKEKCEELVEEYTNKAIESLKKLPKNEFLEELAKKLVSRQS